MVFLHLGACERCNSFSFCSFCMLWSCYEQNHASTQEDINVSTFILFCLVNIWNNFALENNRRRKNSRIKFASVSFPLSFRCPNKITITQRKVQSHSIKLKYVSSTTHSFVVQLSIKKGGYGERWTCTDNFFAFIYRLNCHFAERVHRGFRRVSFWRMSF